MGVNTAAVTSPRTGFAYLDAVLDAPGSVLAFAHRGGAFHPQVQGFENTLRAFRHAYSLGYRYLETDVHVSSDGVLLAFHDEVLDRVTSARGPVSEHTATSLRSALIGGSEEIPTMVSLLEELPDARFNIDLKAGAAVRPLVDLLDATAAHDRVCVGSFSPERLTEFRRLTAGSVATSAHPLEVAAFRLAPSAAIARRLAPAPSALQVPWRRRGLSVVTSGLVRRAHTAGLHVHVWTIDDPQDMEQLLDLGVDGLITDRTDVLRDVLVARDQWREPR